MSSRGGIKRIGIIGAGKIGSAMIKSFKECFEDLEIIATGRRDITLRNAENLGARVTRDNNEAVKTSDLIILSVKPYHFPDVVKQVDESNWKGKIVVSIMAGVKLETLKLLLKGAELYRAMPNINTYVRKSSTAIAHLNNAEHKDIVENIFSCLGSVYWVPEEIIDAWTALAGSGPAYITEIIDALVLGGIAAGMPRDLAYKAILDVLEGTVKLLRNNSKVHPLEVRDEVITPAGTTIRGLMILESYGVKAALMKTIEAAYRKSLSIGEKIDTYIKKQIGVEKSREHVKRSI
ncbi:MAG: pyrroline-5-carboxylate reductase [Desulfurococcaceae archaeon]